MNMVKERLAQELHVLGEFEMEKKARAGEYDDFESQSATPIMDLVSQLQAKGYTKLVTRVINGEFDAEV